MPDEADIARLEQLLEETREIAEENNQILRELRRNFRISFWVKVVIWVAVLALPFILIGPILNALVPATDAQQGGVGLFGVPNPEEIQQLINAYQGNFEGQ